MFGKDFKTGDRNQVYMRELPTARGCTCLTCTGPGSETDNVNGVPAVRPQGDWMMFHSWRGHELTIGSPGYGGMGSALWAMHLDGSDQTQLTDVQPAPPPRRGRGDRRLPRLLVARREARRVRAPQLELHHRRRSG